MQYFAHSFHHICVCTILCNFEHNFVYRVCFILGRYPVYHFIPVSNDTGRIAVTDDRELY